MYVSELDLRWAEGHEEGTLRYEYSLFRPAVRWIMVRQAVHETIGILLVGWKINGQVLGEEITTRIPGGYRLLVRTPARDALSEPHHSDFAREGRSPCLDAATAEDERTLHPDVEASRRLRGFS